jgi:hypothetical protein
MTTDNDPDLVQVFRPPNCTECDLCLPESVNKKRWMAFAPPALTSPFEELDDRSHYQDKTFAERAAVTQVPEFFDALARKFFRRVVVANLIFNTRYFFIVCRDSFLYCSFGFHNCHLYCTCVAYIHYHGTILFRGVLKLSIMRTKNLYMY